MGAGSCASVLSNLSVLIFLGIILNGLLTWGYYALLFNTSLLPFIATFSFIFFAIATVAHAFAVAVGISSLYYTGLTKVYDSSTSCKNNCITILSFIIVTVILVRVFLSIKMKNVVFRVCNSSQPSMVHSFHSNFSNQNN